MKITRTSIISGVTTSRDLDITEAQLLAWKSGQFVQDAFPTLSASDREFFMTGITEEEWERLTKEDGDA
jgi:hypothetical protein